MKFRNRSVLICACGRAILCTDAEAMPEDIEEDLSLLQLINVASLPGIQKYAIAMPDIHQGYGFPIGGVAATVNC